MPRQTSNYPAQLLSLITSTTYPSPPSLEGLEALQAILQAQAASTSTRLADFDPAERERLKRERKEKKRKEREERERDELGGSQGGNEGGSERAMLEANERAGQRLEAVVAQRVGQFTAPPPVSKKGTPSSVKVKRERTSLSPAPSNASSASFRPQYGSTPITYAGQLKKKKRKNADSDDESRDQRSGTQDLPSHATTSGLKVKLAANKARPVVPDPSPTPPTGFGAGIDFSLPTPASRPLITPRPGVQRPPKPGPKRQADVDEDFSNTKAPTQVNFPTWWNTVEPYIRDLREDDLAILTLKADAPESYEIPPRGRHYTEVWDEEDGVPGSNPRVSVPNMRPGTTSHWAASDVRDEYLVEEHRGLGPLTERIVAAIIPDTEEQEDKPAIETDERAQRVDVLDLEDRMKKELRAVMLLGEHEDYDPSSRDDDEITASLRQCQRLLLQQTSVNEARKARLAEIAKHRLAYGEYLSALEGVEKSIEASWAKRIKKYGLGKKGASSASTNAANQARPPVPDNLKRLVAVRKEWLDTVGLCMKERPRGEVVGLPSSSIYEGIMGASEEDQQDEKAIEEGLEPDDAMDVDDHA